VNQEILLKREGIKSYIKSLIKQIKQEKKWLENDIKEERIMGMYEDCGEFYRNIVRERKTTIETLIGQKIRMEKFAKRLKHEAEESK
jgi:polyhydroxyalkanoate synthesis regulator phasin